MIMHVTDSLTKNMKDHGFVRGDGHDYANGIYNNGKDQ